MNKQFDGCEVNITNDVSNCGACGTTCSNANGSTVCTASACMPTCSSGYADCDGNKNNGCEANEQTDPNNCGGCGVKCAGTSPTCTAGVCAAPSGNCSTVASVSGAGIYPFVTSGEGVVATGEQTTPANAICPTGKVVLQWVAASYGTPATADNPGNTSAIATNADFSFGTCSASDSLSVTNADCPTDASGSCTSLTASNTTFGDPCVGTGKHYTAWAVCGTAIDAGPSSPFFCSRQNIKPLTGNSDICTTAGTCQGTCDTGFGDCNSNKQADGCEAILASDPNNCGGCGTVCTSPTNGAATCASSACSYTCNSGYSVCGSSCVNEQTDSNHCGSCTNVCGSGSSCSAGSCINSQTFTSSGTFTVPAGVTSISVVAVGGGGGGAVAGAWGTGGGGGQLCYANSIPTTPGDSITVGVGAGGASGANGTSSSITYGSVSLIAANGAAGTGSSTTTTTATGSGGAGGSTGGGIGISSYTCYSGGNGGTVSFSASKSLVFSGGGGAGGYSAGGGNGGGASNTTCTVGTAGSTTGGGGAGGGGGSSTVGATPFPTANGGSGGGVGLVGFSSGTATAGTAYCTSTNTNGSGGGGGGGAGGANGSAAGTAGSGGAYGGGGGGAITGDAAAGANGAVRIIWGTSRTFPSNAN